MIVHNGNEGLEKEQNRFFQQFMFYKSGEGKRIWNGGGSSRRENIHKMRLQSDEAEKLITNAWRENNNKTMQALAPDGKLQETEFQYHKQCYWNYVYNYIYADKNLTSEIKTDAKFDEVVKFVKKSLIDYEKNMVMVKSLLRYMASIQKIRKTEIH